eukprot:TRINITY_DN17050_c0_g1_i1.p1 TRINITY_DN17050_c0_g1~~TRINITY_DN17050_c0_g1_i1.p1  ORF type:complete len:225 (+),score=29.31 TRINITY_DN17050_c0_g1_i1:67-741(+)
MAADAARPFLSGLAIRRWKARFPHWPPKDASPVTPIEPWGKQFFVYNAPAGVDFRGDPRAPPLDALRPAWLRDEDAASMLREGESLESIADAPAEWGSEVERHRAASTAARSPATETVLCATDFRQRPLLYLKPDEWAEVLRQLPVLRERLRRCQAKVDEADERSAHMKEYWLRRRYVLDKFAYRQMGRDGMGNMERSYETGKIGPRARTRMGTPLVSDPTASR